MNSLKLNLSVTLLLSLGFLHAARADQSQPYFFGPFELTPSGKSIIMVGAGVFDAFLQQDAPGSGESAVVNVEYRFGRKFFYLGFVVGGLVNSDGGSFVYVGNYADIRYKRFVATPVLSLGAYEEGDGPDLGGTFEFRSSIALDYEIGKDSRVGVRVSHTSNAGIHEDNPGANELLLTYSFSF